MLICSEYKSFHPWIAPGLKYIKILFKSDTLPLWGSLILPAFGILQEKILKALYNWHSLVSWRWKKKCTNERIKIYSPWSRSSSSPTTTSLSATTSSTPTATLCSTSSPTSRLYPSVRESFRLGKDATRARFHSMIAFMRSFEVFNGVANKYGACANTRTLVIGSQSKRRWIYHFWLKSGLLGLSWNSIGCHPHRGPACYACLAS